MALTERDREIMKAIAHYPNSCAVAEEIAWHLGYRPSRKGILAVTSSLRSIQRRFPGKGNGGSVGEYLVRLPPIDQWGQAKWALSDKARKLFPRTTDKPKGATDGKA